ncbi:MAG: spermidine synthase [Nitrospiraceae bacterium]|nr:MAG: spermidine synthase [Nitrospiraceae bacterium]
MKLLFISLVYLLFFLSGAAALVYQVVWVRSLSLIFGGTHLAVTTVLSVFMGGLALGSHLIGKRVDEMKNPLRFYGILEIGIALSAVMFIALINIYPSVYIFLVQGKEDSRFYLTFIRVVFAFISLIIPATLMGGTLPVLTRFIAGQSEKIGTHLSLLYGINTFGAVAGTAAAGFYLLRSYGVSTTLHIAIAANIVIGVASLLLDIRMPAVFSGPDKTRGKKSPDASSERDETTDILPLRLVLFGIGVSGFCALGYEVLWTRVLTLTIGTSVYGFTIMLAAFLTGIALGSQAYGLFMKILLSGKSVIERHILGFGGVQVLIGMAALFVTFNIRDLPLHSVTLKNYFLGMGLSTFNARQWANLAIAFTYMLVPAFFMGLAFPLAGRVNTAYRNKLGHAVGDVLAYNTIGAILGSAVSGYFMIYFFGLERSLQLLTVINTGFGFLVIFSLRNLRSVNAGIAFATVAVMALLILNPHVFRMWDAQFFAIFQNNRPEIYDTPEKVKDAIENTDVLFYHEGIDSTISSIKARGGSQSAMVNGKVVASDVPGDRQLQLTLGHLPMLLHKKPEKVFVVGLGTGMTLGAASVHPEIKELTLAEIEPNVTGVARTFGKYNNYVLENPKLRTVFTDGRNYLLTTEDKFDVINADPIHPWTQGSGYLYTADYFRLASEKLLPGGIVCQWLPIYELSIDDLRSVAKTFSLNFKYTMAWLTYFDAALIGSNSPLLINEEELQRRIAYPAVSEDLKQVMMGSADEFLSYFIMGTEGMKAFSSSGTINTDDNLYLEFSAPRSMGKNVMEQNVSAIVRYRESILPYLVPAGDEKERQEQKNRWELNRQAAAVYDPAHFMFLGQQYDRPEFRFLMAELDMKYPWYAPGRFLQAEHLREASRIPVLLRRAEFAFLNKNGQKVVKEISAVIAGVSSERAALLFVDNEAKIIYGQVYFNGNNINELMNRFADNVLSEIQQAYYSEAKTALSHGKELPSLEQGMDRMSGIIKTKVQKQEAN